MAHHQLISHPKDHADRIFTMNAMRRAWRQIRRNGSSPGIDGVSPGQFEDRLDHELNRLRQQLIAGTYRPVPVKRFHMRRPSGKKRPITIWAVRDRVAQRAVVDYLAPAMEGLYLDCSYGYRQGKSIQQAIGDICVIRDQNRRWVLDADIQACFASVDCNLLLGEVKRTIGTPCIVQLIELWLRTSVHKIPGATAQVSQGGVISPLLANLYLHRFDEMITSALPQSNLVRFADDFVILSQRKQEAQWSQEVATRSLANLKLRLHPEKTRIVHFDEGFQFLGVAFRGSTVQIM